MSVHSQESQEEVDPFESVDWFLSMKTDDFKKLKQEILLIKCLNSKIEPRDKFYVNSKLANGESFKKYLNSIADAFSDVGKELKNKLESLT